jgi:hypothetical protein
LAGRDRDPPRNVIPPIPAKFLLTPSPVHWDQSLDRRRLEFSGLFVTAGWLRRHDRARNRGLFPYRPIRALPTPTLHFSLASARLSRADLMGPPASSNGGCGLFAGNRAIIRSSTRAHAHASWGCDRPRCGAKTRAGGACWRVFGQSRSRQGAVPFPRWTIDRPGDRGRPGPHRGGPAAPVARLPEPMNAERAGAVARLHPPRVELNSKTGRPIGGAADRSPMIYLRPCGRAQGLDSRAREKAHSTNIVWRRARPPVRESAAL